MTLRRSWNDLDYNGKMGDWYFIDNETHIVLRFGETLDDIVVLPLFGERAWSWNGDKENPTLRPSILVYGKRGQPNRWHGFLTDGKLETL